MMAVQCSKSPVFLSKLNHNVVYMRGIILLLVGLLSFWSCSKDEVNPFSNCQSNATPLEGRYLRDVFQHIAVDSDVLYGTAPNGERLLLDFYHPPTDSATCQRPLLIWIHGGGFHSGSKTDASIQQLCENMAKKGYVCASINYRLVDIPLYTEADLNLPQISVDFPQFNTQPITDAMHDAKAAIRFFKEQATTYRINPNKIVIGGVSEGAITALNAAYVNTNDEVYPHAQPRTIVGASGHSGYTSQVAGVISLCGRLLTYHFIDQATDPPLLFAYDNNDPYFTATHATALAERANEVGLSLTNFPQNSRAHCGWSEPNQDFGQYVSLVSQITSFLNKEVINN